MFIEFQIAISYMVFMYGCFIYLFIFYKSKWLCLLSCWNTSKGATQMSNRLSEALFKSGTLILGLCGLYLVIRPIIKCYHDHVQLKAIGLPTTCFPSDHWRRAKLVVPDGIELAVNVTT